MPDASTDRTLLGLLGTATVAEAAVAVRSNRLNKIAKQQPVFSPPVRPGRGLKENARVTELRSLREDIQRRHPVENKAWRERQLDQNPDEFRKATKARRLADRAARASKMAKGVTRKMGALGATAGMADAIGSANRIDKEGGSFEARFGKFAEELLGLPSGATQRPLTEQEKKAHWST